jgi:hypothetical protein
MDTVPVVTSWAQARPEKLLGKQDCTFSPEICALITNIDTKFDGLYEQLRQHMTTLKGEYAAMKARLDEMIAAGVPETDPERQSLESNMGETGTQLENLKKQLAQLPGIFEKVSGNLEKMRAGAASLAKMDDYEFEEKDGDALSDDRKRELASLLERGKIVMGIVMDIYKLQNLNEGMFKTPENKAAVQSAVAAIVDEYNAYAKPSPPLAIKTEEHPDAIRKAMEEQILKPLMGINASDDTQKIFFAGLLQFLFDHASTTNNAFIFQMLWYLHSISSDALAQNHINVLDHLGRLFMMSDANPVLQKQNIVTLMSEFLGVVVKLTEKQIEQTLAHNRINMPNFGEYEEIALNLLGNLEYMSKAAPSPNEMSGAQQAVINDLNTLKDKLGEGFVTGLEQILKNFGAPRYNSIAEWDKAFTAGDVAARQSMYFALQSALLNQMGGDWETLQTKIAEVQSKQYPSVPLVAEKKM